MSILSQISVTQAQALAGSTIGRFDFFVDSLDDKLKAYDDTNTLIVVGGSNVASGISYTLTVPADWDGTPANVQQALDELASRVKAIEGKTDLITVTSSINLDDLKSDVDDLLLSEYKAKVSGTDTTGDFLSQKLPFSEDIYFQIQNPSGDEKYNFRLREKHQPIIDTVDPTINDDIDELDPIGDEPKHSLGQIWLNETTESVFIARDLSVGAADWGVLTPNPSFSIDLDSSSPLVTRVFSGGRTTFTVTHALNTLDIKPQVFRLSDGRTIGFRAERTGVNTVEVSRNGNIADGLFRLVI